MERVHSMFSSSFATPAGQLVEKATSSSLTEENWGLNMEVCDAVNGYSDGAKDAVKAITKRLSNNKHFSQINLSLSLLEACVKNCGSRFHILITTKEFCTDTLLKVIQPKNNPPVVLQQRVLGLIKQYAETFGSNPHMSGVYIVYEELREKGYDFPKTSSLQGILNDDLEQQIEGIYENNGDHPRLPQSGTSLQRGAAVSSGSSSITLSNEQIAKLRKDLLVVNGNVKVFSEMLTELNPLSCDPSEYKLLQELHRTCRAMQKRIVELLDQVANEEVTVELLQVNDDLNNIFLRYERFDKFASNKDGTSSVETNKVSPASNLASSAQESAAPSTAAAVKLSSPAEPPPTYSDTQKSVVVDDLIDFGNDTTSAAAAKQLSNTSPVFNKKADVPLADKTLTDVNPASQKTLSEQLAAFDDTPKEVLELGSSETEIEQWLLTNGSPHDVPAASTSVDDVTDEFSNFLNQRTAVVNCLPDKPLEKI